MNITHLTTGHCQAWQWFINRSAPRIPITVPVGITLIEHPVTGPLLYDTGLSPRCLLTTHWSQRPAHRLIRFQTNSATTALNLLARRAILPHAIPYIIISHFHNDHLGGVLDFPAATFIGSGAEYARLMRMSRLQQARRAFNPALLPPDFDRRLIDVADLPLVDLPELTPFTPVRMAFSGVYLVDLPGHSRSQYGAYLPTAVPPTFLVADALWTTQVLHQPTALPPALVGLIKDNWEQYQHTIHQLRLLRELQPALHLVASHDPVYF